MRRRSDAWAAAACAALAVAFTVILIVHLTRILTHPTPPATTG